MICPRKEIHDFFQTHYPLYKRSENLKLAILCLYTSRCCYIKLIQTKRKLFLCGFLDMLAFEETRLLIELQKKLLTKKPTADLMLFSDLKPLAAEYVYQIWQKEWDETVLVCNKFHEILPKLPDKLLSFCSRRKENTVLNRLHIGHSYLTHSFILREKKGSCLCCM